MTAPAPVRSIATLLEDLKQALPDDAISVADLADALHERGIAMLLLLVALPMALPLPVPPGVNIALGTPLLLLTAQQTMGVHTLWLPRRIRERTIARAGIAGMIDAAAPWLRRLEFFVRPRLGWLTQDGPSRLFGALGVIMALTVMIPLPLTNTVPSLGIAMMSVGFIMRDGAAVIAGAVIGIGWIAMLACAVIFFGPEAVDIIKEAIRSWI